MLAASLRRGGPGGINNRTQQFLGQLYVVEIYDVLTLSARAMGIEKE